MNRVLIVQFVGAVQVEQVVIEELLLNRHFGGGGGDLVVRQLAPLLDRICRPFELLQGEVDLVGRRGRQGPFVQVEGGRRLAEPLPSDLGNRTSFGDFRAKEQLPRDLLKRIKLLN